MTIERMALSVAEATKILGICPVSFYRHIYRKEIKTIKCGRRRLVPVRELERFKAALATMLEDRRLTKEAKQAEIDKARAARRAEAERVKAAEEVGDIVDLSEAGRILGTDYSHAIKLVHDKKIGFFRHGPRRGQIYIPREELEKWMVRESWTRERAEQHNELTATRRAAAAIGKATRRANAIANPYPPGWLESLADDR